MRRKQTSSFCGSSWDRKAKVAENHKFMENETEMEIRIMVNEEAL